MTDQTAKMLLSARKQAEHLALSSYILLDSMQRLHDRAKELSSLLSSLDTQSQGESKELTLVNFVEANEDEYEW